MEVPSGSPVSLEVRRDVTRGEVEDIVALQFHKK